MHAENANISTASDKNCSEFVSKITQIILRNRIESGATPNSNGRSRTKSDVFQPKSTPIHSRMHSDPGNAFGGDALWQKRVELSLRATSNFWSEGTPIHIDIMSNTGFLLERWVVAFQARTSSNIVENEEVEFESTDLILLTQSLYSEIRGLPLSNYLHGQRLFKQDIRYCLSNGAGEAVEHISSCISKHKFSSNNSFHPQAQLTLSKFRAASTFNGTLFLRVICDSSLSGFGLSSRKIDLPSPTLSKLSIPTSTLSKLSIYDSELKSTNEHGSIICSGSFSPPNISPITEELPNRNSAGSPFPSPIMKKKVLKYADLRLTTPARTSFKNPASPTRRSNLQFGFTKNSVIDHHHDFNEETCSIVAEEKRFYSPDGLELSAYETQNRRGSFLQPEPYGTFVGSYEESILIGRLSTTPSKPLPFLAEIGVLGTGKCKPQLKCPAHVTLSFPAYFYQLDENTPTPYVGTIDLDELRGNLDSYCLEDFPGYRLPFKGQLQIMIKNPSSTSIKVFLIPYDFRDMPAGSKTFLRQKSYANSPRSSDRLKFAIHLTFQMSSKRRLYLTNQLRVVFSPRRLEVDEKLKIHYSGPTFPKYSALESRKKPTSEFSWLETGESQKLSKVEMIQDQGR